MQKPWEVDLSVYEDESELLDGLRRRDPMACTCLLKYFAPRLYRLSWQLLGDADEAEDALQEAFIKACDSVDSFRGESGIATWLHRIVMNTALMRLRKRKSNQEPLETPDKFSDDPKFTDYEAKPDEQLVEAEAVAELHRLIAHLPETLRTAFVLREIEGMSIRECAAVLNIGESAVKVRVHRARLALREALAENRSIIGDREGNDE